MNSIEQLYEMLKKSQEARGYHFNSDKNLVFDLLKGLLINKERYVMPLQAGLQRLCTGQRYNLSMHLS